MDRRYTICLSISLVLHIVIISLFQVREELKAQRMRRIHEVAYMEEQAKKKEIKKKEEKIEKKKPLTPKEPTIGVKDKLKDMFKQKQPLEQKISEEELRKLAEIARPLEMAPPGQAIDISKMIELHKGQAVMDIDKYEKLDISGAGDIEVLRIGGKQRTTQEILAQDKILLPEDATKAKRVGLWTTPGAGVPGTGEKVELERAKAEDIREGREAFRQAARGRERTTTILEETKSRKKTKPKTEVQISGALKDRKQISAPLPPYPNWALKRGLSAFLQLQLKVGQNGKVGGMVLVISTTGYKTWDNEVIKWLKENWKWKKLPVSTSGFIAFKFIIG